MPIEGEQLLAGGGVPQLDCMITTPGRQPLPVGREGHRLDRARMPLDGEQLLAGAGVPQPDRAIPTLGRQPFPVRREGHGPDNSIMSQDRETSMRETPQVVPLEAA